MGFVPDQLDSDSLLVDYIAYDRDDHEWTSRLSWLEGFRMVRDASLRRHRDKGSLGTDSQSLARIALWQFEISAPSGLRETSE